jgi:multidrug efflux system outer membrane protein
MSRSQDCGRLRRAPRLARRGRPAGSSRPRLAGLALLAVALLGGCAVSQDYQRPAVHLPAAYPTADLTAASATAGAAQPAPASAGEARSLAEQPWREVFTDAPLQALIEEALKSGPDGLLAAAQVQEAAALAGIARAPRLPGVALNLNTSPIARLPGDRVSSSYLAGAAVTWELDLWGRIARASEAARADLMAREENQHGVTTSVIGQVASLYYQLAALREIQAVTQAAAANQREGLRLIQRTSQAGISTAAEERQQESALAATEARLPPLRRQIAETQNALAILMGRHPGGLRVDTPAGLIQPAAAPSGLPSALLERRPDLRRAEAQIVAANARLGEARARFFPSISLTAVLGGVSTSLGDALTGQGATVASLGPGIVQPLFQGGALTFNRDAALARLDQALIVYRKTILAALGEVADSLSAYETSAELLEVQGRRATAAREALRLADLRFRGGITSFLEVLDAQRQQLAADTEVAQSLLERRQALIRLYLALGGGWQAEAPASAAPRAPGP